jgi:Copper transport outer membrane protein, MctB
VVLDNWIAVVIDFRYHLVSIIAVFMALAVGLLVGVTALTGPAEALLQKNLSAVHRINSALAKSKKELNQRLSADQAFAQASSQRLLGGLLTGQKVVLVTAPSPDGAVVTGVTAALKQAGATVTGTVSLNLSFLDTSAQTEDTLNALASQWASTANVTLPSQSSNPAVSGQQAAAAVIAAGIIGKDGTGLAPSVSSEILSPFAQHGYLSLSTPVLPPATLAVLVVQNGPPPSAINAADEALVAVAQQLRAAGRGTVMAGGLNAIGPGSAISAAAGQVSTVDDADFETGQIIVVQALVEAYHGKPAAAYGYSSGKAPSPAPTPSPSATVSTSPGRTTSSGGKKAGKK